MEEGKKKKKHPKKWESLFPEGQMKAVMKLTIVENEIWLYWSTFVRNCKQSPSSEVNQIFFSLFPI